MILNLNGAIDQPSEIVTRHSGKSAKDKSIEGANSLIDILYGLVDNAIGYGTATQSINTFFANLQGSRKFRERFYSLADAELEDIFSLDIAKLMVDRTPYQGLDNLRNVLNAIMADFYYEYSFISSPYLKDGLLRQIVFKPDNFLVAPPKCNIIFPNMAGSISYSRNFMSEPTRLGIPTNIGLTRDAGGANQLMCMAYAPVEIAALSNQNALHKEIIPQEIDKGIVPVMTNVKSSTQIHGADPNNPRNRESTDSQIFLEYAAAYMLNKFQTSPRSLNVSGGTFNPNLVVNFPAAVIVEPYIIMGVIRGINHGIDSQGSVSTTVNISNARLTYLEYPEYKEKEISELKRTTQFNWTDSTMSLNQIQLARLLGEPEMPYPPWLNFRYLPDNIDNTYMSILGCKSIMEFSNSLTGKTPNSVAQTDILRNMYEDYANYQNKSMGYEYSREITSRPIITKKEFFETFLGLLKVNDDHYSSPTYFSDHYQDVIFNYKKQTHGKVGYIK
jgi:hypothetical protein